MFNQWVRQGTLAVLCSIAGWGCFSVLEHTLQPTTQAAPTEFIVPARVKPRAVKVEFFYPPNVTPPQVLSIGTVPTPGA